MTGAEPFFVGPAGDLWVIPGGTGTPVPTGGGTPVIGGLLYIPAQSGAPSGTPPAVAGMVPVVFQITTGQIWAFSNGAWKAVTTS